MSRDRPPAVPRRILILQGHPDPAEGRFCAALAAAYARGATAGGHEIRAIDVASLDFPLLRSKAEWESGEVPPDLRPVQEAIHWAEHLVLIFPLWLGGMPALTKGLLEQTLRPGFALTPPDERGASDKMLSGRSARVVVTMGMPALVYRLYFRAHSLKALERNILGFVGIAPIHETLVGSIESMTDAQRGLWLRKLEALGREGD